MGHQLALDSGKDPSACGFTHTCQLGIGRVLLPHPISEISLDGHLLGRVTHQTPSSHAVVDIFRHYSSCFFLCLLCNWFWVSLVSIDITHTSQGPLEPYSHEGHQVCQQVCLTQSTLPMLESWPCWSSSVFWLLWGVEQDKGHLWSSPSTDCAIDLFSGTIAPNGRMYLVSPRGHRGLHLGLSHHKSHLPLISGWHRLLLCEEALDFETLHWLPRLNDITIKNRYPLPLILSAFELLQGAAILTKLDLHNANHLVSVQEGTSGRWLLRPVLVIMSLRSFRSLWMMFSGTC